MGVFDEEGYELEDGTLETQVPGTSLVFNETDLFANSANDAPEHIFTNDDQMLDKTSPQCSNQGQFDKPLMHEINFVDRVVIYKEICQIITFSFGGLPPAVQQKLNSIEHQHARKIVNYK